MDNLEERQERLAAILQHSAELTQRTEQMLAEPRPVMTYEPPRQVGTRDAERLEHEFDKRLLAIEARLSQRLDALEARQLDLSAMIRNGLDGLADVAGSESGLLEKRVREEIKREADALRNQITLVRADAKVTTPSRKTISRAPWKDIGDAFIATN